MDIDRRKKNIFGWKIILIEMSRGRVLLSKSWQQQVMREWKMLIFDIHFTLNSIQQQ